MKVVLSDVASGYDLSIVNANFQKIADALNNQVLFRKNPTGEDNALNVDVDANGHIIFNLPTPTLRSQAVPFSYVADKMLSAAQTIVWKGVWVTGTAYDLNQIVSFNNETYICILPHTSGTFNTDLSALKWALMAAKGADGIGSGDMRAINNLSDLNNAAIARSNLGLGDAAVATIGVGVQAYDANTAKTNTAQTFTATQRTNELTDNDGSFDLSASLDFKCTPTAGFALTFTNIPASPVVQKGTILLSNISNYAITAGTGTKVESTTLAKISATGTYELFYRTSNGVVYVTASGALV